MDPDLFSGFPAEGLELLRALPTFDKSRFKAGHESYQAQVVEPAKAFVTELGERLQETISPDIVALARTNGSIAPINNDVRFAKGQPAYKDHLLFRFWEGREKKTAPTLFVRLSPDGAGFATGAAFPSLEAWRSAIDDESTGRPLVEAIARLGRKKPIEVAGASLKRVPAPYAADHPRADLLRHKMLQVRWPEPLPKSIGSARFVDWCATRLGACADIHAWLVRELGRG